MKKIIYLILIVFTTGFLASCEKEDNNPVIDTNDVTAPALTLDFEELVLLEDNAADTITFEWSPAQYSLNNITEPTYRLQYKHVDSSDFLQLTSTRETTFEITVADFNTEIKKAGLEPGVAADIEMRVNAELVANDESTKVSSDVSQASVTAYEVVNEEEKTIYILGDGTEAGWDNEAAIAMNPQGDGVFIDTVFLDPGAGEFMKFISVLGSWAPQWGTDETGTSEEGPLVYRPTEDVEDPPAIPIPDVAGDYIVEADTVNLTYTITSASKALSLVSGNGQTIEMDKTGKAKFTTTSYLTDGTISFVEEGGTNSTWKIAPETKGFKGELSIGVDRAKDFNFDEGRKYTVTIDIGARSFTIVPN